MCRVSPETFDNHIRPKLSPVKIGRCVRFHVRQIQAWLDEAANFEAQSTPEGEADAFETWAEGFDGGS